MAAAIRCRLGDGEPQFIAISAETTDAAFNNVCKRLFDGIPDGQRVVGLERDSDGLLMSVADAARSVGNIAGQSFTLVLLSDSDSEDESVGDDSNSEDESVGDDSNSEEGQRRSAGADKDSDSASDRVLRINFSGGEDAGGLEFSAEDIAELRYAVNVTGLAAKPFPEADAALRAHSSPEGILTRKAFYSAVRSLVPAQAVHGADTRRITAFLTRFFDAFDRPGDGVAQLPDVLVGFSLLCAGNKSDKLVDSFSVMSKVASGAVTRTELWRILRALLSAFGAVASRTDGEDVEDKRARIDDASADVVRAAVEAVGDHNGRVTFQQFAGWFNEEGRGKCPWLELLDLNKWLRAASEPSAAAVAPPAKAVVPPPQLPSRSGEFAAPVGLSASRVAAPPSEGSSEDLAEDENSQDPVAFRFDLGRDSELVGRASDIGRVALLLSLTGLHRFTPAEMAAAVMSESHSGVITRAGFDHLAKRLVDVSSLRADERRRAGALLATVFYSFDKFRRDEADATHLATGMLALAGGSKSCKLDVAWTLFEGSRSAPGLTRGLAWECISSLLTGLASLCRDHVFTSVVEMRHVIESGAVDTVSRLFDETRDREDQAVIAFTRFARWYNERGHAEGAVWMELLDHTKWPTTAGSLELPSIPEDEATRARARQQLGVEGPSSTEASVPVPSSRAPPAAPGAEGADVDEGDAGDDDQDEDESLVYSFVVSEAGDVLELTRADCDFLHAVAASAGMSTRPATDLLILQRAAAASNSSVTTSISKLSFSQAMEALLRGSGCEGQALRVGRSALRALFSWFDWTGTDQAETAELIVGLSLFCGGSKSVKMALAFDVLDEGGDGALDHMQLWLFFRSYLLTLGFVQAGSDPLSPSDRRTVVRRVAVEATIAVFESVARAEHVPKVSRITFAQFGQWYNSGGFEPAAWLELLDLSKWSPPSVAAATVARRRLGFDDSRTAASATVAAPYVGRAAFSGARPTAGEVAEDDDDAEDDAEDEEDEEGEDDEDEDDEDGDEGSKLSPAQRCETPAFDFALLRRPEALQAAVAAVAVRCGGLIDSTKLRLTLADCAVVSRIVSTARMDSLVADDIVALVLSAASAQRSSLTRADFERTVLAAVLPRDDDAGRAWLAGCLERLFGFMDRESTGRASAPELAAALTLFASGSKTEKLTAAWAAFSGSATGRLAKLGLWQLLRSLLGVLCVAPFLEEEALTAAHAAALRDEIDVAAISVADSILEFSGEASASWGQSNGAHAGSGSVAFDDFADWYNEGGASQARWVELLDLTKWPDLDALDASPRRPEGRRAGAAAAADEVEEEADEADDDADADADADADSGADNAVSASIELLEDGDQQWLSGDQASPGIRWFLLTQGDVAAVEDALAVTGIAFVDPWDICKAVVAHAGPDNSLSRDGFIKCMRELLSPARVPAARVEMAQRLIWRVWYAVDPHGDDSVPAASAAAALTLLAGGSKSGKIASAFEAAAVMEGSTAGVHPASRDDENPSFVTRDSLKLVIRGFVAALLGLTEQAANASPAAVAATSEIVAKRVAHRVFAHAGSGRSASFIDFGNWYNAGGFKSESWVEMLDLRKWSPSVAAFVGDPEADDDEQDEQDDGDIAGPEEDIDTDDAEDDDGSGGGDDGATGDDNDDGAVDEESVEQERSMRASASRDAVFGFRVMAGGNVVALSAHDVAGMSTIVREARLDVADPEAILEAFNQRVNSSGELDRDGFAEALSSFVDPATIPAETLVQLRSGLERMFDVFDEDASGTVDFAEFAAGFSVLCSGSKSDKLVLAFRLFDIDGDGFITHAELEQYLSSFVAALISFGGAAGSGMARLSAEEAASRRQVARQMAADLAGKILEQADTNKDGLISFAEFGEWYNSGGHELVPWMEMLSTGKWGVFAESAQQPNGGSAGTSTSDAAAASSAGTGTGPSSAADDQDDDEGAVANDTVMLGFDLPGATDSADGSPLRVELTARDARQLRRITSASRLRVLDPDTLHTLFDAEADEATRTLDEAGFARVMERVVPRSSLTDEDAAAVRSYVGSIFAAFDTSLDGRVDFAEFAAGFSILCAGSKSDKLALAFRLFDTNGDGRISRVELALYVRAFLLSLITLLRSGSAPLDEATRNAASREAAKVAGTVFAAADLNGDGSIDFQEFGTWYNSGGHNLVPWIELLDQSKWPLQDDRQVAMLREPYSSDEDEDDEDVDVSEEFGSVSAADAAPSRSAAAEEATMQSRNALERVHSLRPGEHTIHVLVPAGRDTALTPVAAFAGRHTVFADRLSRASTLSRCSASELFEVVRTAFDSATGRENPVAAFAATLARRAADAGVAAEERAWLSAALPQVLSALRIGFGSDPSAEELAVALLPLCSGSKSPKFAMAAEGMADRPMSCLSHVGVRAMLHAMIQGLLAVRGVSGDDARRLVDGGLGSGEDPAVARGMSHLAIEVGLEAGLAQRALSAQARGAEAADDASDDEDAYGASAALSFEALSMWYNEGGHTVGQWLELLDISKWPPAPLERPGGASAGAVSTSPGSKSTRTDEGRVVVVDEEEDVEGEAEDVGEGDGDGDDGAAPPHHALVTTGEVFRLPLMPRADAPGEDSLTTLVLSFPDCAVVQRAIRSSGLDRLHVTSAMQAAREAAAAGGGAVLAADLERTLMAMAPASDHEQVIGRDGVTDLSRMCAWLADGVAASSMAQDDQVALAIGAAIAPFCAGSKSDKLAALFTAFAAPDAAVGSAGASEDVDEDLGLDSTQLACLLSSVLTGFCAVSSACRAADPAFFEVQQLADAVSTRIAATVGRDVQGEGGLVTFGQFGEWYNGGGYVEVQWLELMDQRKWPDVLAGGDDEDDLDDEDDEDYVPGQSEEDMDDEEDSEGDDDYEDEDESDDEDEDDGDASAEADSPEEASDADDVADDGSQSVDMTSPPRTDPAPSVAGHAEAAAAAGAASADGSAAAVFSFVVGRETELVTTVNLSEVDRTDFRAAAASSGLDHMSARDLVTRVFEAADASRCVAPDGLRAVLRGIRKAAASGGEGADDLRFSTLFSAMLQLLQAGAAQKDQGSLAMEDSLDASAAAVCLTVCCSGSKTDKMRSAFFTTSALMDGYLSLDELAAVLANFLTGIFAASSSMARHSASRLARLAVVEGRQVASSAFSRTMRVRELVEPPQAISFDEFGAFYNELGFRTAPWVEMLGFSKW